MARTQRQHPHRLSTRGYAMVAAGIILLGTGLLLVYRPWSTSTELDAALRQAMDTASQTTVHAEYVETEASFPDRTVRVAGTYLIDPEQRRYSSHSTTTLAISGMKPVSFTLENIAVSPHVYTRIQTEDKVLKDSIPHSPDWRRFRQDAVPAPFANISIPGPILNNLRLFSGQGAYVSFVRTEGTAQFDGEDMQHYVFRLSPLALSEGAEGTLGALIDRIGTEGTIDVWVGASSTIRALRFTAPSYRSTTTIFSVGEPLFIDPPAGLGE